jgi:hypothetical protein
VAKRICSKNLFGHGTRREYIIRALSFVGRIRGCGCRPFGFKGAGFDFSFSWLAVSSAAPPLLNAGNSDRAFLGWRYGQVGDGKKALVGALVQRGSGIFLRQVLWKYGPRQLTGKAAEKAALKNPFTTPFPHPRPSFSSTSVLPFSRNALLSSGYVPAIGLVVAFGLHSSRIVRSKQLSGKMVTLGDPARSDDQ